MKDKDKTIVELDAYEVRLRGSRVVVVEVMQEYDDLTGGELTTKDITQIAVFSKTDVQKARQIFDLQKQLAKLDGAKIKGHAVTIHGFNGSNDFVDAADYDDGISIGCTHVDEVTLKKIEKALGI